MDGDLSLKTTFEELIARGDLQIGDGYRAKNNELGGNGKIFLRAGHVTDSGIDFSGVDRFSESVSANLEAKTSKIGDTIVTTKGNSTGRSSFVEDWMPEFVYSPHLSFWRSGNQDVIDNSFLRYWSKSKEFLNQLNGMKVSTDMAPYLSLTDQRRLQITLLSINEQRSASKILSALDDKIELNRKTNEILEGIAKALFKSWFVDFDPVRAKAEGRPTGLPDEISELFPDSFEESELGEIPSGWNIGEVQDLCEWVSSGGTPARSNKEFWSNGDIPWFKTGELNDGPLLDSAEKINELAVNKSACKLWEKGTILFAIYASPTVGRLGVLTSRGTSNQAAAGLKASKSIGTPFLRRCLLFSRDDLQNIAVGAAQQNINVKILKEHKVVIPPQTLAGRFSALISDFDDRQEILVKEVSSLEQLRDALLPRLISGELRVPDAEKMIEEAGV